MSVKRSFGFSNLILVGCLIAFHAQASTDLDGIKTKNLKMLVEQISKESVNLAY